CQTQQVKIQDGVKSSQSTGFVPAGLEAPYSGQPVRHRSETTGGEGTRETFDTVTTYGHDIDPVFRTLHILTAEVQTVTTWVPEGGIPKTMQAQATGYAPWPSGAGPRVVVPAPAADFSWLGGVPGDFPFATWKPGDVPEGWSTSGRILGRTRSGLVIESDDGCG